MSKRSDQKNIDTCNKPNYFALLQNMLDDIVAQSDIILVACYSIYYPHTKLFEIQKISINKSAPRKYILATKMIGQKKVQFSGGEGFIRDQIITDGITRVILNGQKAPKVYRFINGKLLLDKLAFPPDRPALISSGLSNYIILSSCVPLNFENKISPGYVSIALPDNFSECDLQANISVLNECEKIIYSDHYRMIF